MTDINTAIAEFKGWKWREHKIAEWDGSHAFGWFESDDDLLPGTVPDFEHDARLYMALFEEMDFPDLYKNWNDKRICDANCMISKDTFIEADTIGTAICLAYAKWKGIEVVG